MQPPNANPQTLIPAGALDGLTLMRYAHIYRARSSGGVEQYLRHLNRGLLLRHRMTILQMHLTREGETAEVEIEAVGLGRILWIPVPVRQSASRLAGLPARIRFLAAQARQPEGFNWPAFLRSLSGGHLRYPAAVFSDALPSLLQSQQVGLLAFHWLNYDAAALIAQARRCSIPYVLINHFDNQRLASPETRAWVRQATGLASVSSQGLPPELEDHCVNLSDAVDTEFFSPSACGAEIESEPIVLLPARICERKGHRDLIEAARILQAQGTHLILSFVGAVESPALLDELRQAATAAGLAQQVRFPGEISAERLRSAYAQCSFVVLPSYSEGLPRVLIEAQAMAKPIVAYDNSGMKEAVIDGETGFLVKTGDVQALAGRIGSLLRDPAQRLRFGQQGRAFILRQFAIPALIQRHEAFYLQALQPKSAA